MNPVELTSGTRIIEVVLPCKQLVNTLASVPLLILLNTEAHGTGFFFLLFYFFFFIFPFFIFIWVGWGEQKHETKNK